MKNAHRPSVPTAPSLAFAKAAPRERGFTLIEVMVALIVLVLGVLGAAAMTLNSLRDNKQSALRSQAAALAYELSDLMRANPNQDAVFTGATPSGLVPSCYTTGCLPAEMASSDYYQWATKLTRSTGPVFGLPNATWKICRDSTAGSLQSMSACDGLPTSPLVVKLKWDEKYNSGALTTDTRPGLIVPMQPY